MARISVTREPEWDDDQRDAMLGLGYYEAGICRGCGFHHSLTEDRRNVFQIEDTFCNVCAGASKYARVQQDQDSEHERRLGDNAPPAAPRPSDGRQTVLRRVPSTQAVTARAKSKA